MQYSQRLDERLRTLREEVRTMTQEKEQGERVWRDRLQRCQRQLKAKEDEMSRQSLYFENFKTQLQQKLSSARDREQSLQNRIYTLEKQLLDMTVSAATGMATISAVRITAGTAPHWEEQDRLPCMRGEGEGEEERKEERRRQWQPSAGIEREGDQEGDEGKTEKEMVKGRVGSNEARLQGFILSLQEDLRVLLEREEDGMTERRGLMEQLQEAQEKSHLLGCKMEEMKLQVHQLKLSEGSLMQEVEELREENHRLQEILTQTRNQAPSQSESTPPVPGTSSASCRPAARSPGEEFQPASDVHSSAVPPVYHKAAAESNSSIKVPQSSSAKSGAPPTNGIPLNLFQHRGSTPSLQSLPLTTETLDEFKLGMWCSGAILNLEECPSEESDALREAYRSLGLGEDLEALQGQRDGLEAALQHTQVQLQVLAQENTQLKLQMRTEVEQGHPQEKIPLSTSDGAEGNTILTLAQDDLVQALNKENRALADRLQDLLAHIELREEEIKMESTQLREQISRLEADGARLEHENQEQGCLITELTQKTEDDLNTIMELQQRLTEGDLHIGASQVKEELRAFHLQSNWEENTEDLVGVEKVEKPCLNSKQQTHDLTAASSPGSQHDNHSDLFENSLHSSLDISSSTDQVGLLSRSIQSLKSEQEELSASISSLTEQQREVELSVQTQTEVKQQLTRTVWGLKEERDGISHSLGVLKQEREQLSRAVCVLKDERDQCRRSTCGLKEEKEQLTESLSSLEREKEKLFESLSSGREEKDQIAEALHCLQTEREQLRQALLDLKQERDELNNSLKCLREQRDEEQSSYALQEDHDKLIKSVGGLREEKERIEFSIRSLKQEEEQIKQQLQALRKEKNGHNTAPLSPEERHPNSKVTAKTTEGECATQSCLPIDHRGNAAQEQSDLLTELEALKAELKKSQDEVEKLHIDTGKLQGQLCESEAWRTEAERNTALADDRVEELQSKLTGLVGEKAEALSLKTLVEEQYNVLSAQLKAKTVALEELNSEYISLKQGQGNKENLSAVLVSLRVRYDDIRAKYDVLLKKRSQNELDLAPLKAKLSCLVVKCQERNRLLVQMVKAMHRHGIADSTLTQQVEQLLSDAALQDYTTAFTPSSNVQSLHRESPGFTPGFLSKFQGYTPAWFTPASPQEQHGLGSGVKCGEPKSANHTSLVSADATTKHSQDGSSEVTPVQTETLQNMPESAAAQETPSPVAPGLTDSLITDPAQLCLSANGAIQATSEPKSSGFHAETRGTLSPDLSRLSRSSPSPTPSSSSPGRRLSSPEKIINLQEQLQKALKSSFQVAVGRGGRQQPKRSLSFLDPADLRSASRTKKQGPSLTAPNPSSLPVPTAPVPALHTPAVTSSLVSTNKSALFNAVASKSAHVILSPDVFTKHQSKGDKTTSGLSSSPDFHVATVATTTAKSTSSNGTDITASPKASQKISAVPEISPAKQTALTLRTWDADILISSDSHPKTTTSNSTACKASFIMPTKTNGSPERPKRSALISPASSEKTKTSRPKPEAPAKVRSIEVIKTVGQSSLLIGWERPPLDELGCSNGTFVYGYRVFVDGDFHKSVMSSACTKCILENVDLSVPVHIGVQTLGSNGLTSPSVHTTYRISELH